MGRNWLVLQKNRQPAPSHIEGRSEAETPEPASDQVRHGTAYQDIRGDVVVPLGDHEFAATFETPATEQAVARYFAWARSRGYRRPAKVLHADRYVAAQFIQDDGESPWHADFIRSIAESVCGLPPRSDAPADS